MQAAVAAPAAPAPSVAVAPHLLALLDTLPERYAPPQFRTAEEVLAARGLALIRWLRDAPVSDLPTGQDEAVISIGQRLYALHAMLVDGEQRPAVPPPDRSMIWVTAGAYALFSPRFVEAHGDSVQQMIVVRRIFGDGRDGCSLVNGWKRTHLPQLEACLLQRCPASASSTAAASAASSAASAAAASAAASASTAASTAAPAASAAPPAPSFAAGDTPPFPPGAAAGRVAAPAKAVLLAVVVGASEAVWRGLSLRFEPILAALQRQTRPDALEGYARRARSGRLVGNEGEGGLGTVAPIDRDSVEWLQSLSDAAMRAFLEMVLQAMADPDEVAATAARGTLALEQEDGCERVVRALPAPRFEQQCAIAQGLLRRCFTLCAKQRPGDCNPDRSVGGDGAAQAAALLADAPDSVRQALPGVLQLLSAHPAPAAGPEGGAPTASKQLLRFLDAFAVRGELHKLVPLLLSAKGSPGAPTGKALRSMLHICLLAWPGTVVVMEDQPQLEAAVRERLQLLEWLLEAPERRARLHTALAVDAQRACERGVGWLRHMVIGQEVQWLATELWLREPESTYSMSRLCLCLLTLLKESRCLADFGKKRVLTLCMPLRKVISLELLVSRDDMSAMLEQIVADFADARRAQQGELAAAAGAVEAEAEREEDAEAEAEEEVDDDDAADCESEELPETDTAASTRTAATLLFRLLRLHR